MIKPYAIILVYKYKVIKYYDIIIFCLNILTGKTIYTRVTIK